MSETVEQFDVIPSNTNDRRIFSSGTEEDMRTYVVNNFPRPHVEPGVNGQVVPDVYVKSPDGTLAGWDGKTWTDPNSESSDGDDEHRPTPGGDR